MVSAFKSHCEGWEVVEGWKWKVLETWNELMEQKRTDGGMAV